MRPLDTVGLIRRGTLDAELAALLWLLAEGGVPIVVAGSAAPSTRRSVAEALVSMEPVPEWEVLDSDDVADMTDRLGTLVARRVAVGLTVAADDLEGVIEHLTTVSGLPEDAVRRLGVVVILEETEHGTRCPVVHYLRPVERDGQGHVQRRPPAVLAAWDSDSDSYEHYAWGITPELADRVDRAQADFEGRGADRARFLAGLADAVETDEPGFAMRVRAHIASEPAQVHAPLHEAAKPSPFSAGLTDPDPHTH